MNSLNRLVLPVEYPSQTTKVLVINIFGKANGLTGSGIFSGARIFAQTLFRLLMTTSIAKAVSSLPRLERHRHKLMQVTNRRPMLETRHVRYHSIDLLLLLKT